MITNIEKLDSRVPESDSNSKTAKNRVVMQVFELIASELVDIQLDSRKFSNPEIRIKNLEQQLSIQSSRIKILESLKSV